MDTTDTKTSDATEPDSMRARAIARLLGDVQAAMAAGRSVNENAVVAAHPELMPELAEQIRGLFQPAVDGRAGETIARPRASTSTGTTGDGSNAQWAALRSDSATAGLATNHVQSAGVQVPGYSIQRELSRGGQGVVYVAVQLSTGRKVALKVMREGPMLDERSMARFQREVQILAALDHPNIVSIIDTGRAADGSLFISMPYISGVSLTEYMTRRHQNDGTDPSRMLRLFYKICMAVNEAHLRGIVHRDLKPANIRVDERSEPHILDFGLARSAVDRYVGGAHEPVSVTGEFLGSLPWSSPEQAEGEPDKIDVRSDVYSLGVILYQMITGGRFPYEVVGNIRDVLNNIVLAEPKPPRQVLAAMAVTGAHGNRAPTPHKLPVVNELMEGIVLKALAKRKGQRYSNAGELGKDVARYLRGRPPGQDSQAKAPIAAAPVKRLPKGRHVFFGSLAVLVLGGAAWLGIHAFGNKPPRGGSDLSGMVEPSPISPISPGSAPLARPGSPAPTIAPGAVDVLAITQLPRNVRAGQWSRSGEGVQSDASQPASLEIPYTPVGEYDFEARFVKVRGTGGVYLIVSYDGHQVAWILGGIDDLHRCRFELIDGQAYFDNSTIVRAGQLANGQEYVATLKVREKSISAYLNGILCQELRTDYSNVRLPFSYAVSPGRLGVASWGQPVLFKSARVIPVPPSVANGMTFRTAEGSVAAILLASERNLMVTGGDSVTRTQQGMNYTGADNTVRFWDLSTGQQTRIINRGLSVNPTGGGQWMVTGMCFSPDGTEVAVLTGRGAADWGKAVSVWRIATGEQTHHFVLPGRPGPTAVSFSKDGHQMYVLRYDTTLHRYDLGTNTESPSKRLEPDAREGAVHTACWTSDRSVVIGAYGSGTIRFWSMRDGRVIRDLKVDGHVRSVALSADDRYLLAAGDDKTARVWEAATGNLVATCAAEDMIRAAVFAGRPSRIVFAAGATAVLWDVNTRKEIQRFSTGQARIVTVAASGDGTLLAVGCDDHSAHTWPLPRSAGAAYLGPTPPAPLREAQ